ncbi:MAG: hypothetical protein HY868_14695 [Chloroflexi bacterium]|nr:hypothetical protein [Chloroflexota bacterium]
MIRFVVTIVLLISATACSVMSPSKPTAIIASPPSGSVFREGEEVAVQASATDARGITRIELVVDGVAIRSENAPGQASFVTTQTWRAMAGSHVIGVRAYNTSGAVSDLAAISILVSPSVAATSATPTNPPPRPSATLAPAPTQVLSTATRAPTLAPAPTQAPTSTSGLAIQSFTIDIKDIAGIKQVTFAWKSTGGVNARIVSGTSQRFPQAWNVQPNGTLTVELKDTIYPNPAMTLYVFDAKSGQVSKTIATTWACAYNYFFAPIPGTCPDIAPAPTAAAEESFQNGRMVWLKEMRLGQTVIANVIVVLYADGTWQRFNDSWNESLPASDPAIIAPSGLYQPVRGFGKVWRESASVRAKLGWATTQEKAFDSIWQTQKRESLPSAGNLKLASGQVIELLGDASGSWKVVQ